MCDPITLGLGLALSTAGGMWGRHDQLSNAEREANAKATEKAAALAQERSEAEERVKVATNARKAAEDSSRWQAEESERRAESDAQAAADQAAEESELAAMQRRCGKDFKRVEIGMSFDRVRQCATRLDWERVEADGKGQVWRAGRGMVRVVNGRVVALLDP